jgi:hypothetical protein
MADVPDGLARAVGSELRQALDGAFDDIATRTCVGEVAAEVEHLDHVAGEGAEHLLAFSSSIAWRRLGASTFVQRPRLVIQTPYSLFAISPRPRSISTLGTGPPGTPGGAAPRRAGPPPTSG